MDKEIIQVQITPKWARMWMHMFEMLKTIFEIAKSEGIKNINDININKLLKWSTFIWDNWKIYSKDENKEIIKRLIHLYVGLFNNFNQFWTNNIDKILKKINDTLLKLENIV